MKADGPRTTRRRNGEARAAVETVECFHAMGLVVCRRHTGGASMADNQSTPSGASLSVILVNFNHAHYLSEAIERILGQERRADQFIIADDASTDESVPLVRSFIERGHDIQLHCNETNVGVVENVRRACTLATGDYLFLAAADDVVQPGYFDRLMKSLGNHPGAGLACANPSTFIGGPEAARDNGTDWSLRDAYLDPVAVERSIGSAWIPGHASIYRRSAFNEAGGYLPDLQWHCDWFTSLVIAFRHGLCHVPETLSLMRLLPESYSAKGRKEIEAQREVLERLVDHLLSETYRDVSPRFLSSGVLAGLGTEILPVLRARDLEWMPTARHLGPRAFLALAHSPDGEVRSFARRSVARYGCNWLWSTGRRACFRAVRRLLPTRRSA